MFATYVRRVNIDTISLKYHGYWREKNMVKPKNVIYLFEKIIVPKQVIQNTLRTCEGKRVFLEEISNFQIIFNLNKCRDQIKLPNLLYMRALFSELTSNDKYYGKNVKFPAFYITIFFFIFWHNNVTSKGTNCSFPCDIATLLLK